MTNAIFATACLFLSGMTLPGVAVAHDFGSLGGGPVCEASTVEVVACNGGSDRCLLVGDNEVRDELFLYKLPKPDEPLGKRKGLAFGHLIPVDRDNQLSDIEAMAVLPNKDEIIIFGSHSRNKKCDRKKKRRGFVHARIENGKLVEGSVEAVFTKKKAFTCDRLFGDDRTKVEANAPGICEAIKQSEENANAVEDGKKKPVPGCNAEPPFNLEGAFAVNDADGEPRVWVGLRAPLVHGMAPLLRLVKNREKFRFSAAALIDLRGNGIRALTVDKETVWGIGGPPADGDVEHILWRFPVADLKPAAKISPEIVRSLPTSAEGIAIAGKHAIVVYDGAARKNSSICVTKSTYEFIELPQPND